MGQLTKIEGEDKKECCANCRFWETNNNPDHPKGDCLFNPVATPKLRDQWCGRFKRIK